MAKRKKPKLSQKPPPTIGLVIGFVIATLVFFALGYLVLYLGNVLEIPFWIDAGSFAPLLYILGAASAIYSIWKLIDLILFKRRGRMLKQKKHTTIIVKKKRK